MPWQSDAWTRALADAITDPRALLARLELDAVATSTYAPDFRCACRTRSSTACGSRDPNDPLLRQVLPLSTERDDAAGYSSIRSGSIRNARTGRDSEVPRPRAADRRAGLRGALPLLFPPHFSVCRPSAGGRVSIADAVERDPSISEVILSGGDPLMLKDAPLRRLVARLDAIRASAPVAYPHASAGGDSRTGDEPSSSSFCATRARSISIVLHVNHPNEIAGSFVDALAALHRSGITLLNQSVLLARSQRRRRRARRAFAAPVRQPRVAVLPASARPRAWHASFRRTASDQRWR